MIPFIQYEFLLMRSGKRGFGLSEKEFTRWRMFHWMVIPTDLKIDKSSVDNGNPGQYTTINGYTVHTYLNNISSVKFEEDAREFGALSSEKFKQRYLENKQYVKKYREDRPEQSALEKQYADQHTKQLKAGN